MVNFAQSLGRDKGPMEFDIHSSFLCLDSGLPQLCLSPRGCANSVEAKKRGKRSCGGSNTEDMLATRASSHSNDLVKNVTKSLQHLPFNPA